MAEPGSDLFVLDEIKNQLAAIQKTESQILQLVSNIPLNLNTQLEAIQTGITTLQAGLTALTSTIATIEAQVTKLVSAQSAITGLQVETNPPKPRT
jgi:homoserine trans-succinylase